MHHFAYRGGELYAEDVPVSTLVAAYGTPLYVYSAATLRRHFTAFDSAFGGLPHLTCFSVKANSNLSVLKTLAAMGAGVDIVSGGELYRALAAGVAPEKIVYSGVGKRAAEIEQALTAGILMFNVESLGELERISAIAKRLGKTAQVSLRINPDVDPKTHPYISTGLKKNKFGLDIENSLAAYAKAMELPNITPVGIDCHIGSQLTSISPFLEALDKILTFREKLCAMGIVPRYLDLGGGLGIQYDEEDPPHPKEFGEALTKALGDLPMTLILEPGRVIVGNAGILVTEVVYTKKTPSKDFVIVDAAMNDLIRPSLYDSFHAIREVRPAGRETLNVDVVGPICESGDFLARDRDLPAVAPGELLAVYSAGAYGFTMSSNYNSRPRAAEVLVDGETVTVARRRETYEDLIALER
ncbi:diaminopimelate decarboxylase [Solidesulfovibrio carbinoliphilus subsp. oakridgensis]|uniref:Diaminopimelate decarboxylase n=1 Tax=Solidesulfovibrio carbinoliphilus subsp. oakridgensis TaxID=694327 RepID=G7Q5T5_9BACT|nr:diaminopimelate decarboxylase [Solidesulfovibrio carbinoliphilus]EHJ46872.1 diaminopimelate decarboxylase [Solidesulfovibrio carbinoliphilus subsp. oakridgensis]